MILDPGFFMHLRKKELIFFRISKPVELQDNPGWICQMGGKEWSLNV